MCDAARDYFSNLFMGQEGVYAHVIDRVANCVTDDDNVALLKPFTLEEFRVATFQMHPDEAPGPDGLNSAFTSISGMFVVRIFFCMIASG